MTDQDFLKIAFNQAEKSVKRGGFPAGAVIVKNGKIVSKGLSLGFNLNDPTEHSETSSIRKACKKLKTTNLEDCILYASLQPCLMCFSVANWANIKKIIYGCRKTKDMVSKYFYEGNNDIELINEQNNHKIDLKFLPDFEKQSLNLIQNWENKNQK